MNEPYGRLQVAIALQVTRLRSANISVRSISDINGRGREGPFAGNQDVHIRSYHSFLENTVQLAHFIRVNIERIAADWEQFAATLLPEEDFSKSILRNGIVEMLTEIANDMDRAQSAGQQQKKSEGDAKRGDGIDTAADKHALERVNMGVSSRHLISEFRALRATVIRLWQPSEAALDKGSLLDLIRFNEAVDQLLAQAAEKFTDETNRSRDLFLGILGHDLSLRNPLAAISGWADSQLRVKTLDRQAEIASQILISSSRMSHMITDLIELTSVRLGSGIVLRRAPADMRGICVKAIEEMESIYPDRIFQLNCNDEVSGEWDTARMTQVLSNLLGNAIQHGLRWSPDFGQRVKLIPSGLRTGDGQGYAQAAHG